MTMDGLLPSLSDEFAPHRLGLGQAEANESLMGLAADAEIGIGLQAQENADHLRRVGPHFHQTMDAGGPPA